MAQSVLAVAVAAALSVSLVAHPSSAYAQAADDALKAGMAADAMRLLQQHDTAAAKASPSPRQTFLAPTPPETIGDAELARFLNSGAASLRGVQVRGEGRSDPTRKPYFEGSFKRTHHAYLDSYLVTYDEGVYAVPGEAAYVGTFNYFGQPTEEWYPFAKGSFVVVGKRLSWDGKVDTGIYVDEQATAGLPLLFTKATPDYLEQFERRHAAAVQSYQRQLAEEASGGLDFGAVLALGFGAALIGSSNLPGLDKLQLGQAFVGDVLGEGDGQALLGIVSGGGMGGGGLFSGGQSFQAPGLNDLLTGAITGQGSIADAGFGAALGAIAKVAIDAESGNLGSSLAGPGTTLVPAPGLQTGQAPQAAQAPQATATTETFSFSCPAGGSHSLPVSYRNPSCGAAMKSFTRVYACNLIGDFAAAAQQCRQACGHPQCIEGP